jgi:hypothetical protein
LYSRVLLRTYCILFTQRIDRSVDDSPPALQL